MTLTVDATGMMRTPAMHCIPWQPADYVQAECPDVWLACPTADAGHSRLSGEHSDLQESINCIVTRGLIVGAHNS